MTAPDPSDTPIQRWQRVEGWLRHARSDERVARACLALDPPALDGAAYHCQQAAEKLLKGYQVRAGIDVRKTHDLNSLGESLRPHFPTLQPLLTIIGYWRPRFGLWRRTPALHDETNTRTNTWRLSQPRSKPCGIRRQNAGTS